MPPPYCAQYGGQVAVKSIRSPNPKRTMTSTHEFLRKFGEFRRQTQRKPVEIARDGRRDLVLTTADAADVVADAVRRAEMTPE